MPATSPPAGPPGFAIPVEKWGPFIKLWQQCQRVKSIHFVKTLLSVAICKEMQPALEQRLYCCPKVPGNSCAKAAGKAGGGMPAKAAGMAGGGAAATAVSGAPKNATSRSM